MTLGFNLLFALTLAACGDKDDDTGDGGTMDGGTMDGGTTDGGTTDGGTTDGGTTDGGTTDGGTTDGGTTDGGTSDSIAIAGSWTDSWGGTHTIDDVHWDQGYASFHISQYDNGGMYAIAQNDEGNDWSPSLWSRFDWTWDSSGALWYCQTAYDAATEEAALATPAADPANPAASGCGSFSWTGMSPL